MDAKELLSYLFAAAAFALLVTGIWAISYYAPARSYERELRRERRARHRRREHEGSDTRKAERSRTEDFPTRSEHDLAPYQVGNCPEADFARTSENRML